MIDIMLHTLCGCTQITKAADSFTAPYFRMPIQRPREYGSLSPLAYKGVDYRSRLFKLDENSGGRNRMLHYHEVWE